jgi:hypothetical protein
MTFESEDDEHWRKPGKQFRARLLMDDDSNQIELDKKCELTKYYQVADRVCNNTFQYISKCE